jgi:hypothetical protein
MFRFVAAAAAAAAEGRVVGSQDTQRAVSSSAFGEQRRGEDLRLLRNTRRVEAESEVAQNRLHSHSLSLSSGLDGGEEERDVVRRLNTGRRKKVVQRDDGMKDAKRSKAEQGGGSG